MTLSKLPDLEMNNAMGRFYKKPNPVYTVTSPINTIRLGSWEVSDIAIAAGLTFLNYSIVSGMLFPYDVIVEKCWIESLYSSSVGVNKNSNIVHQELTCFFSSVNWLPKQQTPIIGQDVDRRVYRSGGNPRNKDIKFEGDIFVPQSNAGNLVDCGTWLSVPTALNDVIVFNYYMQIRPLTNEADRG